MNGATQGPWKPTNSWSRYGTDEIDDHEMMNYNSQIMARAPFTENEECDIPGEIVEEQSVATAHGRTPEEVKANAEFIARACNAHEDLLGACKAIVHAQIYGTEPDYITAFEAVKAAIAKVEGRNL